MDIAKLRKEQHRLSMLHLRGKEVAAFHKQTRGRGRTPSKILSISYAVNDGVLYRATFSACGGTYGGQGRVIDIVDFDDIEKTRARMGEYERKPRNEPDHS